MSVVIFADDLRHWVALRRTLRAVLTQGAPLANIVLAVDANDHLVSVARTVFPELTVVANAASPGATGTRVTGARHCSGRVIAFLGDNAVVPPDWSQRTADAFDASPVIAVGRQMRGQRPRARPSWWPPDIPGLAACRHRGLALGVPLLTAMMSADLCVRSDLMWQYLLRDGVDSSSSGSTMCVNVARGATVAPGAPPWRYIVAACLDATRSTSPHPDGAWFSDAAPIGTAPIGTASIGTAPIGARR